MDGEHICDVPLPGIGKASASGYWSKGPINVLFDSFLYPSVTYTYDAAKNELIEEFRPKLDIDQSRYATKQVLYRSKDGTAVTMFLLRGRNYKNGHAPMLLTGYGGFNKPYTPSYSPDIVVWLERGGVVAIPNLRGGGEYGREWHEQGMRERKQNVFDDFEYAVKWLINKGYTIPDRLAIYGASNGGLLVGAAIVQRPDLFKAAV